MKKKEWEERILKRTLEKNKERKPGFKATSLPVRRLYDPEDVRELDYERDLGYPGAFPYTRGVQPTMYRGKFWTMRQYAGFGSAEESNRRYRYLLEQGQTGLSVAFDLPTQIGLDSDNALCEGEVGKVGVAIDTLADMELLFAEIPLDKVSVSMTINASAAIVLAMYLAVAEKQGHRPGAALGHHPERPAQGIHRPRHLHLPARAVAAHHHRHLLLLQGARAQVEHDLDQRLPYPRGRLHRGAGTGLHLRRRHRLRASGAGLRAAGRRVRAAPLLLLRQPQQPAGRGGQVPRRPPHLGADHEGQVPAPGTSRS